MRGKRINVPKLLVLEGYAKDEAEAKAIILDRRVVFDGHVFSGTFLILEILEND